MEDQTTNVVVATRTALDQAAALAVHYGFSILGAIILLIGGWILAGIISRSAYRVISRIRGIDETLASFFQNVLHYSLLILVFITVLGQFGVQTASIIAALGAAGLAIGLALQGTLQNIAAGIMLLILRPFRVGEYIETANVKGYIRDIGLFATEMKTADGLYLMAPNSTLWNTPIINYSREPDRRQELSVALGENVDIDLARKTILDVLKADQRIRNAPAPKVYLDDLAVDQTVLNIEYWTITASWTDVRHDVVSRLKARITGPDITIKSPTEPSGPAD
ncbi:MULTISPECIES: mechanosensitive ion channel domain-containing protein [Rhizobium]|uniref:Small-conductance mechanosensitive channel n=1 Tax=Rhizobium tropici TaxID=398 RepID=A0A329Y4N5_RHITR|nr:MULTISPECIES: mechanosensitive ion channel domain-containing protein [Rhizobium]MBB3285547.1 small conductance mechanosensitive channel [Rhizobium sp. BK252]MBB3400287.1 small conductance mechanosensitive channel [Rhizobium sp. BK289]MBB3412866.1 small conductance mechanosensitive channel [Rhizobium sp. BK284]MBB3480753.1 small conductance mechanosensitive channel [Rhizobium sp. BK347]RAX38413.1 mechanosensitive ion channel family protein [Rhizobium tropici]